MNRRQFTVEVAMTLLGGATIMIGGCGGANPAASNPRPPTDAVGDIAGNHGHSAVITGAQLGAGGELTLDIRGTSSHSHMVSLSADDLANIRDGARVEKVSGGNSHTHTVVFN